MDIEIKANMQAFKEQVLITEKKCDDEVFKQNQRILKIEKYEQMIDITRQSVKELQFQVENSIV